MAKYAAFVVVMSVTAADTLLAELLKKNYAVKAISEHGPLTQREGKLFMVVALELSKELGQAPRTHIRNDIDGIFNACGMKHFGIIVGDPGSYVWLESNVDASEVKEPEALPIPPCLPAHKDGE
jgi:hypothetical protein